MEAVQPSSGAIASDAGLPVRCRESGLGSDLSSGDSTQQHDLWRLALEKLQNRDADGASEAQRLARYASTATGSNGQRLSGQALCESVAEAAQAKLDIASAKSRWVIKAGGRSISLRVILDNILCFIDKFKEAGDVAVSFDPVHAALPWAGIRFVLQVGLCPPCLCSNSTRVYWLLLFQITPLKLRLYRRLRHTRRLRNSSWSAWIRPHF
jgi:hypothetical protein